MKTLLPKLKELLNSRLTPYAIIVCCIFFWFRSCSDNWGLRNDAKRTKLINDQNVRALTDSVRYLRNKAGDIEATKSAFVTKVEDLEQLNRDLYTELRKEIGNVRSLIKSQTIIDRGELTISNELVHYPNNLYGLKFRDTYSDSSLTWIISGQSRFRLDGGTLYPSTTTINQNSIKVGLVMGFKENDGNYEVWARSSSPLVRFNEMDGVILIPKKADITCPAIPRKKRFGLGPYLGVGLTSELKPSLSVGVGITWDVIQF